MPVQPWNGGCTSRARIIRRVRVHLVGYSRGSEHEAAHRWLGSEDAVSESCGERAELPRCDGNLLPVDVEDHRAFHHDEHLVAGRVLVRTRVAPADEGVVGQQLETLGREADGVGWRRRSQDGVADWDSGMVKLACWHALSIQSDQRDS
jgi:hypothetical protein